MRAKFVSPVRKHWVGSKRVKAPEGRNQEAVVHRNSKTLLTILAITLAAPHAFAQTQLSLFEGHTDVGTTLHPGSATYDPAAKAFALSAAGENMWLSADAFHFVWKRVSGDVAINADIAFIGQGVNEHRKAVVMVRQSLDADSPYADVALHGSGLTSLQYRDAKGALTHEIQANISAPERIRIEKRGQYAYMWLASKGQNFQMAGGSVPVPLAGTFYVGIGLCSHEKDVVEKAIFSNVEVTPLSASTAEPKLYSTLETITIDSTDRRVVYVAPERFEAPNWTHDGDSLIFNRKGRLEKIPVGGGKPELIDTGFAVTCNNDHGISPDSKSIAISDQTKDEDRSHIYIVPFAGGAPREITKNGPSYWHGWSPDGKTLAFVGERNDEFDIYSIPFEGGNETRLTTAKGLDDGPDYSPDGKYIYFNSERTGHMQIWRMKSDGSAQEQITHDELNNWFPHISPDGQWMVFLTYDHSVEGHPEDKDVMLRLMNLSDGKISVLTKLFGGQGTINVPSWSPDSTQMAFVSYQLIP
jgi:TolB protein